MIKQTLKQDMIAAMKSQDHARLDILRYILAKIQNLEINKQKETTDDEVMAIMQKQIKELKETLEAAEKASRHDLADKAKSEITIVNAYLPKQLSDEELKKAVEKIIADNQELYQKNAKAIIGVAVRALKGKANSQRIISVINSL